MTRLSCISLLSLCVLAACGGGATGNLPFTEVSRSSGGVLRVSAPTVEARRVELRSNGVTDVAYVMPDATRVLPGFTAFVDTSGETLLFEAVGETGFVHVAARVDDTGTQLPPSAVATSAGGSLPATGQVHYAGTYAGFLARDAGTSLPNLTQSYIGGQVQLVADFGAGTVSGQITERRRYRTSTRAELGRMEDVTLGALSVADGASVTPGATGGGRVDEARYRAAGTGLTGAWSLVFDGAGAPAAGGTVQIMHDYINSGADSVADDFIEVGGFAAVAGG